MKIGFDNALGMYPDALRLASRRAELIAGNLANADTPGYRARDLPFHEVLQQIQGSGGPGSGAGVPLRTSDPRHMPVPMAQDPDGVRFRQPLHAATDQNTVDAEQEKARFAENQLNLQASFEWLSGRFRGLKDAIRGE